MRRAVFERALVLLRGAYAGSVGGDWRGGGGASTGKSCRSRWICLVRKKKKLNTEDTEETAQRARRSTSGLRLLQRFFSRESGGKPAALQSKMKVKRLLVFAGKLGYQTRSFDAVARKLDVELVFVTDRCHQLDDPWGDRAVAVHFESPEVAAYTVLEVARAGERVGGILALGDRPAVAAAYVARGLGLAYNHPLAVEACRSKLRMREVFRD